MIYRSYIYIHDVYIFMYIPTYTVAGAKTRAVRNRRLNVNRPTGEGPGGFEGQNPNVWKSSQARSVAQTFVRCELQLPSFETIICRGYVNLREGKHMYFLPGCW